MKPRSVYGKSDKTRKCLASAFWTGKHSGLFKAENFYTKFPPCVFFCVSVLGLSSHWRVPIPFSVPEVPPQTRDTVMRRCETPPPLRRRRRPGFWPPPEATVSADLQSFLDKGTPPICICLSGAKSDLILNAVAAARHMPPLIAVHPSLSAHQLHPHRSSAAPQVTRGPQRRRAGSGMRAHPPAARTGRQVQGGAA